MGTTIIHRKPKTCPCLTIRATCSLRPVSRKTSPNKKERRERETERVRGRERESGFHQRLSLEVLRRSLFNCVVLLPCSVFGARTCASTRTPFWTLKTVKHVCPNAILKSWSMQATFRPSPNVCAPFMLQHSRPRASW